MISGFSFKSLFEGQRLIYVAPVLVVASLFHIFSPIPAKHQFGQLEILGSFVITGYYLWVHIAEVYEKEMVSKKRIEMISCAAIGIFSALLFLPPLMTWQYIKLYRASNMHNYITPVSLAVITLWAGVLVLFYSSYTFNKNILDQIPPTQTTTTGIPQ